MPATCSPSEVLRSKEFLDRVADLFAATAWMNFRN
jgi:hypothetical protein